MHHHLPLSDHSAETLSALARALASSSSTLRCPISIFDIPALSMLTPRSAAFLVTDPAAWETLAWCVLPSSGHQHCSHTLPCHTAWETNGIHSLECSRSEPPNCFLSRGRHARVSDRTGKPASEEERHQKHRFMRSGCRGRSWTAGFRHLCWSGLGCAVGALPRRRRRPWGHICIPSVGGCPCLRPPALRR